MAELMRPGALTGALARAKVLGVERSTAAITKTALTIERGYKERLNRLSHAVGTPTPASPGGPPAKITAQLMRSATHVTTAVPFAGTVIRIGPADTPRTTARKQTARAKATRRRGSRGAPSNGQVGKYLETGLRNGARYPALLPAFQEGLAANEAAYRAEFAKPWTV